jgi:TatD DNase family protein
VQCIDIGVNLLNAAFNEDREQVLHNARAVGVSPLIITGTTIRDSMEAQRYAAQHSGQCYATAGIHPHNARLCGSRTIEQLEICSTQNEVVAIGECGLDYNRDFSPRAIQRAWFEKQVELACAIKKPLFLHEREAFEDCYQILKQNCTKGTKMVIHCFTGTEQQLEKYLDLGCYIGITGWVCDERRGAQIASLIKRIPTDVLMLETDAPYLVPRTLKPRNSRNEPKYLIHIAQQIARIIGKDLGTLAAETVKNTVTFFDIPLHISTDSE